jgi:hypothetical protein
MEKSSQEPGRLTYRERRERRAERRRDWAEGRLAKAEAASRASQDTTAGIPFGQPILVGHHSEGKHRRAVERSQRQASKSIQHRDMAERHSQAAKTIKAQLDRSIYDDDRDAIDQLRGRIKAAEEGRERIKRYNASCRKGQRDLTVLSEDQKKELLSILQVGFGGDDGQFPGYVLSNLGGRISRDRKRLARLEKEASR